MHRPYDCFVDCAQNPNVRSSQSLSGEGRVNRTVLTASRRGDERPAFIGSAKNNIAGLIADEKCLTNEGQALGLDR